MTSHLLFGIARFGKHWYELVSGAGIIKGISTKHAVNTGNWEIFFYSVGNQNSKLTNTASYPSQAVSQFDEAFSQLCDPFLPVRGQAMMQLASLLRQRDPKAMESADTLLNIFLEQLAHDDSYIYLAAVHGLVSLADIRANTVMPRLAREFAICKMEASGVNVAKNEDKEKGCYVPNNKGQFLADKPCKSDGWLMVFIIKS